MTEPDNLRRIALDGIERHCGWLLISSEEIVHFVKMLEYRRPYLTEVEDNMYRAQGALVSALNKLVEAQEIYSQLRKES